MNATTAPTLAAGTVSVAQAERLLDLSGERLRQLARAGHIPPAVKGRYPLVGIVAGYIRYLRDPARAGAKSIAEGRVLDARAREIELRIAAREAGFIDLDEHDQVVTEVVTLLAGEAAKLPTRFAGDALLHRRIEAEVDQLSAKMAKRVARRSAALRARVHEQQEGDDR